MRNKIKILFYTLIAGVFSIFLLMIIFTNGHILASNQYERYGIIASLFRKSDVIELCESCKVKVDDKCDIGIMDNCSMKVVPIPMDQSDKELATYEEWEVGDYSLANKFEMTLKLDRMQKRTECKKCNKNSLAPISILFSDYKVQHLNRCNNTYKYDKYNLEVFWISPNEVRITIGEEVF